MKQRQYVISVVSDKMRLIDLPLHAMDCLMRMGQSGVDVLAPLVIFDVAPDLGVRRPLIVPVEPAEARIAVVSLHPQLREEVLKLISSIMLRDERPLPTDCSKLGTNLHAPLKRFFHDMTEQPVPALSVSFRDGDGDLMMITLARTEFTVGELKKGLDLLLSDAIPPDDVGRN